ncbi:hypothetical protein A2773_02310 [Candidatus Gottesmanbacteria bacterium RIFCSPHIGHO2_01_FULL_39_10]|uniref:nicotinate phosphoribosyltransferase n=1 Tax=Candidatus Gottesmanbacteria bacterium RIFCSPHIGHO2_01_FULL_39_10 TaxID=1798375 RepID=A0A1F5ZQ80_9BACT|nr:MAG: hypothetical protein A2773_02310 [Candidatus Gottesmanbacteria bacterium RIFCSPHIGHO2_01_FULL_39_10]
MTYFTPEIIDKIRRGYYSAIYFSRTKEILEKDGNTRSATMQIFQRHDSILCGADEVIELFKIGTGYWDGGKWVDAFDKLKIETLRDGDSITPLEIVMHVTGPYHTFAHLESIYLGILARRTLVATNVRNAVSVASGKSVIFFADRFDHFLSQEGDGYAAKVGGATGVATPANAIFFDNKSSGTMPHALIALYDGDTVRAAEKFLEYNPDVPLIVLVDFHNDVVEDSLKVAAKFGKKLWGVRLDTSYDMVDKSLEKREELFGVNPFLVRKLREELDRNGYNHVKIVASGGFTVDKISYFEKMKTPVDVYGVGSALVKGENDFTADIVKVEEKLISKVGREYRSNSRLRRIG